MLSIDLSGRLAVVTGGSGELGRAIVRSLAQAGADVAGATGHVGVGRDLVGDELWAVGMAKQAAELHIASSHMLFLTCSSSRTRISSCISR